MAREPSEPGSSRRSRPIHSCSPLVSIRTWSFSRGCPASASAAATSSKSMRRCAPDTRASLPGGDLIGGARTMATAVGHGKKAARNIDAFLRGETYVKPPKHPIVPFEALNLPVYLDAARQEVPEVPVALRKGFAEVTV